MSERELSPRVEPPPSLTVPIEAGAVQSLATVEQQYIGLVLRHTKGNKCRAAALLGIDRRTLYRKLAKDRDV